MKRNTKRTARRLLSLRPAALRLAVGTIVSAAALAGAGAAQAKLLIQPGDRVVFYGDSITEGRNYTKPVQSFLQARYPQLKAKFFNAGWGGDRASNGVRRLERDVLWLRPTLVTLCFGMNDGAYTQVNDGIVREYRDNMDGIVRALRAKNIRVVVFSPSCVDYDRNPRLKDADYNTNLAALGVAASEVARKYGCTYFDILHPMLEAQTALKARDAAFTMIPDGVHPDEKGGIVMGGLMLRGLGAEPMPALADISAPTRVFMAGGIYKFALPTPVNVPLYLAPESVAPAQAAGLISLVGQPLRVRNLPASTYEVRIGHALLGEWTAAQLAAGVLIPGTYSAAARRMRDITQWKEDNYFNSWRNLRIGADQGPAFAGAVAGMMKADEDYNAALDSLRAPVSGLTLTVQPSGLPASAGPNLALNKPYEASDPNVFNFGIGGLTDGSWEPGDKNTFATGDKDTFPKTATIDLGAPASIGFVRLGVPPFGSTQTIEVSLSADGKVFKPVGRYAFAQGNEEKHLFAFAPTAARYVRLTYPDHFASVVGGYTSTFAFTSEVEVYAAQP
jgi:lysophospholipase L1-like esterase